MTSPQPRRYLYNNALPPLGSQRTRSMNGSVIGVNRVILTKVVGSIAEWSRGLSVAEALATGTSKLVPLALFCI